MTIRRSSGAATIFLLLVACASVEQRGVSGLCKPLSEEDDYDQNNPLTSVTGIFKMMSPDEVFAVLGDDFIDAFPVGGENKIGTATVHSYKYFVNGEMFFIHLSYGRGRVSSASCGHSQPYDIVVY